MRLLQFTEVPAEVARLTLGPGSRSFATPPHDGCAFAWPNGSTTTLVSARWSEHLRLVRSEKPMGLRHTPQAHRGW